MIMRITWGKLYPGTWDEFERMYRSLLAGKAIQGLRGAGSSKMLMIPIVALLSVYGRRWKTCGRMSKATRIGICTSPRFARFLRGSIRRIVAM